MDDEADVAQGQRGRVPDDPAALKHRRLGLSSVAVHVGLGHGRLLQRGERRRDALGLERDAPGVVGRDQAGRDEAARFEHTVAQAPPGEAADAAALPEGLDAGGSCGELPG